MSKKGSNKNSSKDKNGRKVNTTKAIVWTVLINALTWVWCSYILAALDKIQIAESLSSVAVTSIIGVVFSYCVKSGIENLSKNNSWPDKPCHPDSTIESGNG